MILDDLSPILGVVPRDAVFDEQGQLIYLDLSGLDITHVPEAIGTFVFLNGLDLSNNHLENLPPQIGELRALQRLYLSDNKLHTLCEEFNQVVNLQELNLDSNQFAKLPVEICQLTGLLYLYIRDNGLDELPEAFSQLSNLRILSLNDNNFSSLPPSIGQLTRLEGLSIRNNQLTEIPAGMEALVSLRTLALEANHLADFPIEITRVAGMMELSLARNQIEILPSEIGQLTELRDLDLRSNAIRKLSPEIGNLKKLVRLSITDNKLSSLPPELGQLSRLERLYLDNNQLTELPGELGKLNRLERLYVQNNQLTQLPPELVNLDDLKRLYLDDNQLIRLPKGVENWTNLSYLSLSNNNLRHIPREVGRLDNLLLLEVQGNPNLLTPPPEIIERGNEARLDFMRGLAAGGRARFDAKLLLVGEGATGKTSLLRAMRNESFDPQLSITHGIELGTLSLSSQADAEITLHTWDFGGQQIYQATHQFFLTQRAVYILVWNARMGVTQGNVTYWLNTIRAHAPDSPVILVATHAEQFSGDINYPQLKATFPQLAGNLSVSNETGDEIPELKKTLAQVASLLPQMGQPWPENWLTVESALISLETHHISAEEYLQICQENQVDQEIGRGSLGGFLHDLGKILYFRDDDMLSNLVVLQPNWVTKAISRVLRDEKTSAASGLLDHADLERIWGQAEAGLQYPRYLYPVFLRLMERFDLSYQIQGETPKDPTTHSLIPQLLPHQPPDDLPHLPDVPRKGQAQLEMIYTLSFVPAGIMSWFIVRTHRFTTGKQWRDGALLIYQEQTAFVELNATRSEIRLFVWGTQPHNFFTLLRETVDLILQRFKGLDIRREIPCICHWEPAVSAFCGRFYRFEDLVRRVKAGIHTVQCPETFQDVHVPTLLFGIHRSTDPDVVAKIEANYQVLLSLKTDQDKLIEQAQQILKQNAQMAELLNSNFARLWNLEQQRIDAECPATFYLETLTKKSLRPRDWISQAYRLTLVCQHPPTPHPVGDGYELRQSTEWWAEVSPWINQVVKFLKFAIPRGKELGELVLPDWVGNMESGLDLMTEILDVVPEFIVEEELKDLNIQAPASQVARPTGAALRALYSYLDQADRTHYWSGLSKTITPDGNILWLCEKHRQPFIAKPLQFTN